MAKPPKTDASEHDIDTELDDQLDALQDEPDDAPAFNTIHEDEPEPVHQAGVGRGFVVFMFLLASLLGGAIGWVGPKLNTAPDPVAELAATSRAQFADLSAAAKSKDTEIQKLRTELDSAKRALADEVKATQTHRETFTELSSRLTALEETTLEDTKLDDTELSEALTEISERISALESLNVLGVKTEDGEDAPASFLLARIDALETAVKNSGASSEELAAIKADLQDLQGRLTIGPDFPEPETKPIELPKVETAFDREQALNVLIDTFPRDKMVEAVRAQEQLAAKKPSWLKRVLSRHIKVREGDEGDPVALIDEAEKSVRAGRVDLALEHIAELNPPVRAIAADWIKSAKTFEKSEI